jgi:ABC-type transport system involved in multi-copper enzyme maturation permease subunit
MPLVLRWLLRLGPTNPIAVRLVQGGSRRRRHYYIRTVYLGALIVVLLYLLLLANGPGGGTIGYRQLATAGATAFTVTAYLQIGLICILAPVFMAGAIEQEANPRTWDILLTTPMSPSQIVLGNLVGRVFFIFALLFSSLPLFAVTQYFGGVPGTSIFASYLIAACAALLVAAIAIALSVSRLVGKRAVFAFYVSVVSYLAVTIAADAVVGGGKVTFVTALNPFLALRSLLNTAGYPSPELAPGTGGLAKLLLLTPVRAWCLLSSAVSLALILASIVTVRMGGIAGIGGTGGRGGVPWYRRIFGLGASGAEHRPPRSVWHNPIAWREGSARNATLGKMAARWGFITLGAAFGLGITVAFHLNWFDNETFRDLILYTVAGELTVIALVAVNMAATAVSREREDGTLDLLLTTPMTPGMYLTGKLRGMIAYLLPMIAIPVGTIAAAGVYVAMAMVGILTPTGPAGPAGNAALVVWKATTGTGATVTSSIPAVLPEAGLVLAAVSVPFIAFCVMVGLQWSVRSKASLASVVGTVGIVGAVAGVVGLCGWNAGSEIPVVGPVLAAMTPLTASIASVRPEHALAQTMNGNGGLAGARISLVIGAGVAALTYLAVVYGLHAAIVKGFDMTVRKLAGTA